MLGFLLGSFALFGQHGRGGGGAGFGGGGGGWRASGASGAGFGNILFPGGAPGHPTIAPLPMGFGNTSFGSALGATVRGVPPPGPIPGRAPGYGRGGYGGGRTVIVPYPVLAAPAYYPYGYGYGYDPGVVMAPDAQYAPQQQPPVVIINQNYKPDTIAPVVREYNNLPPPAAESQQQESSLKVYENRTGPRAALEEDKPTIFLIAMKEGNIMPALAFWVEGDTLHYITRESSHNRISLDRIDREFSVRLNKERGLEFRIP